MRCAIAVGESLKEGEERMRKTIENACKNNSWLVNRPPKVIIIIIIIIDKTNKQTNKQTKKKNRFN